MHTQQGDWACKLDWRRNVRCEIKRMIKEGFHTACDLWNDYLHTERNFFIPNVKKNGSCDEGREWGDSLIGFLRASNRHYYHFIPLSFTIPV